MPKRRLQPGVVTSCRPELRLRAVSSSHADPSTACAYACTTPTDSDSRLFAIGSSPAEVDSMWNGKTVAVVLPTYRERATIREIIEGFEAVGIVDEIIVVNNNAEAGTSEAVEGTSAREVLEPEQGYGAAIQRGLAETKSD